MQLGTIYSGTLIEDLMATVERAERGAQQRRTTESTELWRIFELQAPEQSQRVFAGAA
jgi:hypothetical protein